VRLLHGMKSRAAKLRWARGGRAALRLGINEPKMTGARSATKPFSMYHMLLDGM
jgi:hypothetical protein